MIFIKLNIFFCSLFEGFLNFGQTIKREQRSLFEERMNWVQRKRPQDSTPLLCEEMPRWLFRLPCHKQINSNQLSWTHGCSCYKLVSWKVLPIQWALRVHVSIALRHSLDLPLVCKNKLLLRGVKCTSGKALGTCGFEASSPWEADTIRSLLEQTVQSRLSSTESFESCFFGSAACTFPIASKPTYFNACFRNRCR
jgi:hypothetical protein